MNNLYNFFIEKVNGPLIISIFLSFYVVLPVVNVIRAFHLKPLNSNQVIFIFFFWVIVFLVFSSHNKVYYKVTKFIFSDVILVCKDFFSIGSKLLRDYPLIFGIYICVSLMSYYLIRDDSYSHIFLIKSLYIFCRCFRNIFLIPLLGLCFVIKINHDKSELIKNQKKLIVLFKIKRNGVEDVEYDQEFVLFKNTPLIHDFHFRKNYELWSFWLDYLKPSPRSLKISSRSSLLTSFLWYFGYFFQKKGEFYVELCKSQKRDIETRLDKFSRGDPTPPYETLVDHLAYKLKEKLECISNESTSYQNMNLGLLGLLSSFNTTKISKIQSDFLELVNDSIIFSTCNDPDLDFNMRRQLLYYLTKKYLPDEMSNVEKIEHFQQLEQGPFNLKDKSSHPEIFSCIEIQNVLAIWSQF